jgi:methionyl-tRNA formyltransferase
MGTPDFAVPSLDILLRSGEDVVAVVTAPDRPRGRGQELSPTPVKELALRHSLRILQPDDLRSPGFSRDLRSLAPDLFVIVAFRILPREVFTIPPLGAFNLHASLLPKYRGAAPINWAIIRGETETGVTTFFLEEKVDTGNLLLQSALPIGPDDDAGVLHDRLAALGATAVLETVRLIGRGEARPRVQDGSRATPAPKIFKEDCHIRWDRPAHEVKNFIRGLSPVPAAYAMHRGKILKVYRTHTGEGKSSGPPGEILADAGSLRVATSGADLHIDELQQEGRKRMKAEEFLRGYRFAPGDRFD